MSSPETETVDSLEAARADSRAELDAMLEQIDGASDVAAEKVESGRVYDAENEQVRIKWLRALAYLIRTKRKVWEDKELIKIRW